MSQDQSVSGSSVADKPKTASTSTTSPQATTFTPQGELDLNRIGILVDRWSNVFEGMAQHTQTVTAKILKDLQEKKIPDVKVRPMKGRASMLFGIMGRETRPLILAETNPGITTAVYVAQSGSDLYVSWRTHVKGVLNTKLFQAFAVVALIPTILILLGGLCITFNARGILAPQTYNYFNTEQPSDLEIFFRALGQVLGWVLGVGIGTFVALLLFQLGGAIALGYYLKGDFTYYLLVEPSIFDAEDAIALSISVHQTLLHAVDSVGIDITKIPPKIVQSGRRSEKL